MTPAYSFSANVAPAGSAHRGLDQAAPGYAPPNSWNARVMEGEALMREVSRAPAETEAAAQRAPHPTVIVAPCAGARRAILFFPGNVTILSLPTVLFDYPDAHVIIVRDPRRCFCLSGIPALGDSLAECQQALRVLLARLGDPELFVMGASAGGYAALRYALDLGASGVLGLSPPTTLDINDDPEGSTKKYPQLANLYKRNRELAVDLVPLYRERYPRPRAILLSTPSHERDRWLTERMRGLDGVEHCEAPEKAGHRVLLYLNEQQQLKTYVDRLCALKPLSRPVLLPLLLPLAPHMAARRPAEAFPT